MLNRQPDEDIIFNTARRIEDAGPRSEYLEQICAGDSGLRERVEQLLLAHESEQQLLQSASRRVEPTAGLPALPEKAGMVIGRYTLMERIGEGGMGEVYVAEQQRPLRRKVALKLVKPGMDTKCVLARFEAERAALALMDHPNIARVFDAGTTENGRPYFVMELVRGVPITEYCDEAKLNVRERLELFIQVCHAIQHAHQKGIIHRDVKPSNILVTELDGKPLPKVIDFGIAKALGQNLSERTVYTSFQAVVGTPLYMSPEQAALSAADVDTRSDVYSLGVLLYELLTGTTPFEKRQFELAAFDEVRRIIRETDPPKPSTRISSLGPTAARVSACRQADSTQLQKSVRGDLDWIVMKALEKDRNRRYETSSGFAADVRRFLTNEPIEARPPSTTYRARKFVGRNRTSVIAASMLLTSLALGLTGTIYQTMRARDEAKARQMEAVAAREAEAKAINALQRLRQFALERAVSEVLTGDLTRGDVAIALAIDAGVSDAWVTMLKAERDVLAGDYGAAISALTPLLNSQSDPMNFNRDSALAILAMAEAFAGNDPKYLKYMTEIRRHQEAEKTPSERLLIALAEAYADPESGLKMLSIEQRQVFPLALLFRANARMLVAAGDKNQDLMRRALSDLDYAMEFSGETPFYLSQQAYLFRFAYEITKHGDPELARKYLDQGRKSAEKYQVIVPTALSQMGMIQYFDEDVDIDRFMQVARRVDFGESVNLMYAAATIYTKEPQADVGLALFESLQAAEASPYRLLSRAMFLAELPKRRSELVEICKHIEQEHKESPQARIMALWVLALAGRPDLVKTAGASLNADFSDELNYWGAAEFLQFLNGSGDDRNTIFRVQRSVVAKYCPLQFDLGLMALAEGRKSVAKRYFQACVDTDIFAFIEHHFARGFLNRMRDTPDWPEWIETSDPETPSR